MGLATCATFPTSGGLQRHWRDKRSWRDTFGGPATSTPVLPGSSPRGQRAGKHGPTLLPAHLRMQFAKTARLHCRHSLVQFRESILNGQANMLSDGLGATTLFSRSPQYLPDVPVRLQSPGRPQPGPLGASAPLPHGQTSAGVAGVIFQGWVRTRHDHGPGHSGSLDHPHLVPRPRQAR